MSYRSNDNNNNINWFVTLEIIPNCYTHDYMSILYIIYSYRISYTVCIYENISDNIIIESANFIYSHIYGYYWIYYYYSYYY